VIVEKQHRCTREGQRRRNSVVTSLGCFERCGGRHKRQQVVTADIDGHAQQRLLAQRVTLRLGHVQQFPGDAPMLVLRESDCLLVLTTGLAAEEQAHAVQVLDHNSQVTRQRGMGGHRVAEILGGPAPVLDDRLKLLTDVSGNLCVTSRTVQACLARHRIQLPRVRVYPRAARRRQPASSTSRLGQRRYRRLRCRAWDLTDSVA
jgi:hypothetical protein